MSKSEFEVMHTDHVNLLTCPCSRAIFSELIRDVGVVPVVLVVLGTLITLLNVDRQGGDPGLEHSHLRG